jgi:hypothetical protein
MIIFEELDLEWLKGMWHGNGDMRHDMINIIHLVYLLDVC